jgi:hypothetical protein
MEEKGNYNSKERMCKEIMENLFPGHIFEKIRHPKLINPDTNRRLELDLYNAELQLAVEYNGPQHYYWMNFYHKTKDDFEKQKTRDAIKEGYCDILGITIIEIPNLSKYEDIKDFIIKTLESRNFSFNKSIVPKYEQFDHNSHNIDSSSIKTKFRKKCRKCGVAKILSEFSVHRDSPDGFRHICKTCDNIRRQVQRRTKPKSKEEIENVDSCTEKEITVLTQFEVVNIGLKKIIHDAEKSVNIWKNYYSNGLECTNPEQFMEVFIDKIYQDFESLKISMKSEQAPVNDDKEYKYVEIDGELLIDDLDD